MNPNQHQFFLQQQYQQQQQQNMIQFQQQLQQMHQQQQSFNPSIPPPGAAFNIPPPASTSQSQAQATVADPSIGLLQAGINNYKDQIQQSEKNLKAQIDVFQLKKKMNIDESLKIIKLNQLSQLISASNLNINELDHLTNRIIESCTKDAIAVNLIYAFSSQLNFYSMELLVFLL